MGQSISNLIKSIDGGDASARETKDTLTALHALGQSRVDAAYAEATSDRGKTYAPISKVIFRRQQIVCKASTDLDGIASGIKNSVGRLLNGQILDGVVDLIENGMTIVLGASAGQVSSTYTYALIATDIGGLLRIDMDIYNFALQSTGLQTRIQNMMAVTVLVSSIDPTALTASDIRAIISVGYNGSTPENQQAILELVMAAWALDRKQLATNAVGISEVDLAEFRAKIRPSKWDSLALSNGVDDLPKPPPQKVDRQALQKVFRRLQNSGEKTQVEPIETPIRIWIKLANPAEEIFITWLTGILTGLAVPNIFLFKGIDETGYSGDALSLNCAVIHTRSDLFEVAITYVEDTVLYCLNNAGLLTTWITTMGIQYKHPGSDESGFVSRVSFKSNAITNNSKDTIQFLESETAQPLLQLPSGQTGVLTGIVDYISGPIQAAPGPVPTGPGAQPSPAKWITYDSAAAEKILSTMPVNLQSSPHGGYSLSFTGPDDQLYILNYGEAWPR